MVQKTHNARAAVWSKLAEIDESFSGALSNQVSLEYTYLKPNFFLIFLKILVKASPNSWKNNVRYFWRHK